MEVIVFTMLFLDMSLKWLFSDGSSESNDSSSGSDSDEGLKSEQPRVGRPSLHVIHKDLVPCVKSFIQQNTAAAHMRRRDSTMHSNGVSLKEIVSHVKRKLGISVSRNTIHRLLKPKRAGTHASKRFKSLINARIPPKNNSGEKKVHSDFHYTCTQINRMATLFWKKFPVQISTFGSTFFISQYMKPLKSQYISVHLPDFKFIHKTSRIKKHFIKITHYLPFLRVFQQFEGTYQKGNSNIKRHSGEHSACWLYRHLFE